MLKNYILVSYRNMNRNKIYSLITVMGLSIGIIVCLLILLWMKDELSFDKFHQNSHRLARAIVSFEDSNVAVTPAALASRLIENSPEIEATVRFKNWGNWALRHEQTEYINFHSGLIDQIGLDIFTFPLLVGNPKTALENRFSIVLTKSAANRLFPEENPMGKTLEIKDLGDFIITGIIADVTHSHFQFDFLVPFEILKEFGENIEDPGIGSFNFTTYVLLKQNVNIQELNQKMHLFFQKNGWDDLAASIFFQPFEDIYLRSHFNYDFTARGDMQTIYLFGIIAFLVLLIACINFINLKTAKSQQRSKEVGLRKVIGASKKQIIFQFIGESFLTTLVAFAIALIGTEILLPYYNDFVVKDLGMSDLFDKDFLPILLGVIVFTGFFSGFYPAFYLSNLKPIESLQRIQISRNATLRTFLVIFQFTLSSVLLISALTISDQLKFISQKELGYQKHHLLYTAITPTLGRNYDLLKQRLLAYPFVKSVSASTVLPIYECPSSFVKSWEGKEDDRIITVHNIAVDYDFLKTMGIMLLHGRTFSPEIASDSTAILVNETLLRVTGIKNPLGKTFYDSRYTIIGVMKDFHFNTVRAPIAPLTIPLAPEQKRHILVRIEPHLSPKSITTLQTILKEIDPDVPSEFRFFDETLQQLYAKERNSAVLINWFTILAMLISCLGLYGLAAFITEQKQKEIGIRKVLGATTWQMLIHLNLHFIKWVLIGNIIAIPCAYVIMQKWLENFAYATSFRIINIIICFLITLIIAISTSSFHTIRSSLQTPVKSLRYE